MLVMKYPEVLKCIPILLAVRSKTIFVTELDGEKSFLFSKLNYSLDDYKQLMHKTGVFNLLQNRIINNLIDYVTGVEVGLDSNGRKNRSGHLMEALVEDFIKETGAEYYREMKLSAITKKWGVDLSKISNNGKTEKRFDFVVKTAKNIYCIETNFYSGGGSKLNETARSYKNIALESKEISNFSFVWITDGKGWNSARHNLEETFDVMDNIYCIEELTNKALARLFKDE